MMNDGGLSKHLSKELAVARRDRLIRDAVEKEVARMVLAVKAMDNGIDAFHIEKALNGVLKAIKEVRRRRMMTGDQTPPPIVVKQQAKADKKKVHYAAWYRADRSVCGHVTTRENETRSVKDVSCLACKRRIERAIRIYKDAGRA